MCVFWAGGQLNEYEPLGLVGGLWIGPSAGPIERGGVS